MSDIKSKNLTTREISALETKQNIARTALNLMKKKDLTMLLLIK